MSRIKEVRSMCCTSSKTQADVWGTSLQFVPGRWSARPPFDTQLGGSDIAVDPCLRGSDGDVAGRRRGGGPRRATLVGSRQVGHVSGTSTCGHLSVHESYDLSRKVINLLRHNQKLHREEDGSIQLYKIKFHLRDHHSQIQNWSDDRWKACLAAGGGSKTKISVLL